MGLDIFLVIIINVHINVHDGLPRKPEGCAHGCPQRGGSQETAQGYVVVDDFSGFFPRFGREDGGFPGFSLTRMPGILATRNGKVWRTRKTPSGGTAPSFCTAASKVKEFLKRKWQKELDYRLKKELWGFRENRMALRFEYEWHDAEGQWFRSYGNELWEFADNGLMLRRYASINDAPIREEERRIPS
jgi:nuclear transport factor 2 (NTF2) superfamily protein